jgi:hypothetical protein
MWTIDGPCPRFTFLVRFYAIFSFSSSKRPKPHSTTCYYINFAPICFLHVYIGWSNPHTTLPVFLSRFDSVVYFCWEADFSNLIVFVSKRNCPIRCRCGNHCLAKEVVCAFLCRIRRGRPDGSTSPAVERRRKECFDVFQCPVITFQFLPSEELVQGWEFVVGWFGGHGDEKSYDTTLVRRRIEGIAQTKNLTTINNYWSQITNTGKLIT